MLCTSISMPRLFMQPSFRPYPSISSPIISLPLRRNNTFPIRVPTSSESQTKTEIKSKANPKQSQFKIFSSQSQISSSATTTTATTAVEESPAAPKDSSGSDVIGKFYGGINAHDLGSVEDLIAENCIYEDLIFPQPFVGRKTCNLLLMTYPMKIRQQLGFHGIWNGREDLFHSAKDAAFTVWTLSMGRDRLYMGETVWNLLSSLGRQLWLLSEE